MREFVVRVADVTSFDDFIAAFNEGFCRHVGGWWNGNLNAFHDYLSWPEDERYRLVLQGWDACVEVLGQEAYLPGQSMLDVILEIFRDNDHVELVLN